MTPWSEWCWGVMIGMGEPLNAISIDTHWAWSNAETAPYDLMRWNNPQNSTEKWSGSRDSGAQPGAHDVQIYASVQDGIDATIYTLTQEPYYPAICADLRAGLARQTWGATSSAGSELHAWGTGTAWLSIVYPALPSDIVAAVTTLDDLANGQKALEYGTFYGTQTGLVDPSIAAGAQWTMPDGTVVKGFAALYEYRLRAIVQSELAKLPAGGAVVIPTNISLAGSITATGKLEP